MKATTAKKILIGAVAALCVTTIAGVTALAVYTNRQLNAENTLTVGKEVDTVVISGGNNYETPLYPGDSATFTYNIDLTGHTADDVTISWELKDESESNVDIGVNATLNSVGFVAAYGTWDKAQNNYRVEVYGTFNAYGTNQTPPNVVSSADPDAATGTYVADGATYQVTDLPLEDWAGSSGSSSEDVTE